MSYTLVIRYSANGGSNAPSGQSKESSLDPVIIKLSSTQPTRSGYSFLGWSESSSASSASYQPGANYSHTFGPTPETTYTVTLYAVWSSLKSKVSAPASNIGQATTITVTRYNNSYTHTITYSFGSASGTIVTKSSSTSISWTPPANLASQIPNATHGTCTLTCTTYNGNTSLGTTTATLSLWVLQSVKVTVGSVTTAETVAGLNAKFGGYVQGKSKVKFTVTADTSNAYGATMSTLTASANGQAFNSNPFTTGLVNNSGTNNYSVTITDSRGRTDTASGTYTVFAYSSPTVSITSLSRDSLGTSIIVKYSWSISAVSNRNDKTIKIYIKAETDAYYGSAVATITPSAYSGSGTYTITGMSASTTYNVMIEAIDYFATVSYTRNIASTGNRFIECSAYDKTIAFHGDNPEDGNDHFFKNPVMFHANTTVSKSSGGTGYYAERSDTGISVALEVGSGGTNHGVYSSSGAKWIIYDDGNGDTYIPSVPTVGGHSSQIGTVLTSNLASSKNIASSTWTNVVSIDLTPGTWMITARCRFSSNASGYRCANITQTSAGSGIQILLPPASGNSTQLAFTKIVAPTANTTYYLNAYQTSGSQLSMAAGSDGEINALVAVRIA